MQPTQVAANSMAVRNLALLVICQCFAVSGTILVITVGGIIGVRLAPDPGLATLPVSLMIVGTALAALPVAWVMSQLGRRLGLALGTLSGAIGAGLAGGALWLGSFPLFCCATLIIGVQIAFSQHYRFAAAESVAPMLAGRAIAIVLVGSLGGALLGPWIAASAETPVLGTAWLGGFVATGTLSLLGALLLLGLIEPVAHAAIEGEEAPRSLRTLFAHSPFVVAVLAGVVGQGTMTFVMTATPVSMHVIDHHDMAATSAVIRAHVLGMYVPSLISASLIGWLGARRLMVVGVLALAATAAIALQGHEYLHYWWALVLLGIGWNFLFVGGTSQLVASYRPAERFQAQACNDFAVFGASAIASLLAGSIVIRFGWDAVLWSMLPMLGVMLLALMMSRAPVPAGPSPDDDGAAGPPMGEPAGEPS